MNDTAVSIDEQIRSFALAVRTHLDDLPTDELDEIVGGLTADLADQAADNGGVLDVGDPAAYAEELRTAAGLPPRSESRRRVPFGARLRGWRGRATQTIRRSPIAAWFLDLLLALRPVWWVLRGYGLYVVILAVVLTKVGNGGSLDHWMVPDSLLEWAAVAVLAIVSVQWGRGQWLPRNALRHIRTVSSVVALLALAVALPAALTPRVEYVGDEYGLQSGLRLDGVQINNIFAFDAEGNPIDQVQLFTGKGTPIDLYGQNGAQTVLTPDGQIVESENGGHQQFGMHDDGLRATIPGDDYRGRPVWNVYPLDEADLDQYSLMPELETITRPEPPFQKAPGIDAANPTPTPSPSPSPSDEAVPSPTETPAP
ncbi:hypothetical protein [uncultured Microbacterium sp.]|uniref:hypothetical protein n=1 Tax=uncultured Microbacterium sp. TaxID=191216 RepID=UPI0028D1C117|nr:hypothetical protein [uncultured Microbacterium sp.]